MNTSAPSGYQGYDKAISGEADEEITRIDRGTPCGEYLRRYWQPVSMSSELGELPMAVEILGEPLVLFRDRSGEIGLLHRHCSHRGASLEYGIIAERGIICCYHGWHYNVDGTLRQAGSEPADSPICSRVVHGAYPTREYLGIIFAYLGPPDHCPPFPEYDVNQIADTDAVPFSIDTPCNWLQIYENTQDPIHVLHLHARSSGVQFGVASGVDQSVEYMETPIGMINIQSRQIGEKMWIRCTESIFPNGNQTGAIWEEASETKFFQRSSTLRWMVPINNTLTRTIGWRYFRKELDPEELGDRDAVGKESIDFIGQTADERPYHERQRQPGDYEAQVSQRSVAVHALEHHGSSDAGVVRIRHLLRKRIRALAAGEEASQPEAHDGVVNTFTQDTVVSLPADIGQLDMESLRASGREVTDAVVRSAAESPQRRISMVRNTAQEVAAKQGKF